MPGPSIAIAIAISCSAIVVSPAGCQCPPRDERRTGRRARRRHSPMATSSPPATPMSQASTKVGHESSVISDKAESFRRRALERVKQASTAQDVLIFLIAFRILNALSVKTFFQPDEFFQSLEPAWDIAFGANTGAWITWVRRGKVNRPYTRPADCFARNGKTNCAPLCIRICLRRSIGFAPMSPTSCNFLRHGMPT